MVLKYERRIAIGAYACSAIIILNMIAVMIYLAYKQSIKAYKKESARASESKGEATNVNESMRGMVSSDNQSTFENLGTLQMTKQSNDQVTEQITDS